MLILYLLVYLIVTYLFIKTTKPKLISIATLFVTYNFLFFFLASLFFTIYPTFNAYYKYIYDLKVHNTKAITNGFATFLLFYSTFLLSYFTAVKLIKKPNILQLNMIESIILKDKNRLLYFFTAVTPFLILTNFLFRKHFLVGIPSTEPSNWKPAEYIWYFFDYGSIILILFSLILSVIASRRNFYFLNSAYFFCYAVTQFLLGWKGPIVFSVLGYVTLNAIYWQKLKSELRVDHKFIAPFIGVFFIFFIISLSSYSYFRTLASEGKRIDPISGMTVILEKLPSKENFYSSAHYIVNRFVGINAFTPINTFLAEHSHDVSIVKNIFSRGSIFPERFLTEQLFYQGQAGVNSTNAVTIYGALKVYGSDCGILLGGLILGYLFGLLQLILDPKDGEGQAIKNLTFLLVFIYIFPQIIFEGNFIFFVKRSLFSMIILILALVQFINIFNHIVSWNKPAQ